MTEEPPDPLTQLAMHHGTDKYGEHLYTPEYHRLFAGMRERKLRLLEIGIGGYEHPGCGGQGLRMWADYFPNAEIVGLDLHPKQLDMPARVTIRQGAQNDPAVLDRLWAQDGPFDIVIDDGSHQVADVLASFTQLYPLLPEGGIYVVEDTQTALWPAYGGSPQGHGGIFELANRMVLGMHRLEAEIFGPAQPELPYGDITRSVQFLRNLIVFERGENTYPSNHRFNTDHAQVRQVLDNLNHQARRAPSPGPALTRAKMEISAGHKARGALTVATALVTFPDDQNLAAALQDAAMSLRPMPQSEAESRTQSEV